MRIDGRAAFAGSVALSVALHVFVLVLRAPVTAPESARRASEEFRMINAVVVAQPTPPAAQKPKIKPPETRSKATVVEEKPSETPTETEKPPEETPPETPAPPGPEVPVTSSSQTGAGIPVEGGGGEDFLPYYKVDTKPEYLVKAPLEYPAQARRLNKTGSVVIEADIDSKGQLVDARVIKGAGFGFDEAALKMVTLSRFTPAYAAGKPVAVRMRFTVKFTLK